VNKPIPTFSWDDMDQARAAAGLALDDVPDGAASVKEWAERYGMRDRAAANELDGLVRGHVLQCGWTRRGHRRLRVYWPA